MINVNFALVLNWYSDGKIKGKIDVDTLYKVFENQTKSNILQHCERSELRLSMS